MRPAFRISALVFTSGLLAATLTGCALNSSGSGSPGAVLSAGAAVKPSNFMGLVHGGQQPVTGAVVTLWAAGTSTGYGRGATAIASTATDALGNFSLNPATVTNITGYAIAANVASFTTDTAGSYTAGQTVVLGNFPTSTFFNGQEVTVLSSTPTSFTASFTSANVGANTEHGIATYYNSSVSSCTTGQYLYITAVGGNPGVGGTYGTVNQSGIALMAALPTPCVPATTGASSVFIDEVTTAAAVTALQQFMTINPAGHEPTLASQTTPPWTIGAPSTNTTGLANAFAVTSSLASISSGATTASNSVPFVVASTVGGNAYTMQVQPDALKLNTMADVLAACFTGGTGTCTNLIADATPSGSTSPIDTIQIAYYLATNPAGLTMPAHGYAAAPYWQCLNYVTPTAPFLPAETCSATTPTFYDWTMAVKWTLYNSASTKLALTPTSIAIDAGGHIWTGGGSGYGTLSPMNEFSVTGQYLLSGPASVSIPAETLNYYQVSIDYPLAFAGQTGVALTYGRQDGLAIDTTGDVFFVQNSPVITPSTIVVTTPGALTFLTGMLAEIPAATVTAGTSNSGVGILSSFSNAMAIAGNNDIFISDEPVSSRYYTSTFTAASGYTTLNEGGGRSTGLFQGEAVDQNGFGIGFPAAVVCTSQAVPRNNTAGNAALPVTPPGTAPAITLTNQCANYGAVDTLNNLWVTGGTTSTGTLAGLAYVDLQTGPATPLITSIGPGVGGLLNPTGLAVDGVGNVWVTNGTSGTSGLSEFTASAVTVGNGADTLNTVTGTTVLSPSANNTTGFDESFGFGTLKGVTIDLSGNLWLKVSGSTVAVVIGAAAPVQTPMAAQLAKTAGTAGSIGNRP